MTIRLAIPAIRRGHVMLAPPCCPQMTGERRSAKRTSKALHAPANYFHQFTILAHMRLCVAPSLRDDVSNVAPCICGHSRAMLLAKSAQHSGKPSFGTYQQRGPYFATLHFISHYFSIIICAEWPMPAITAVHAIIPSSDVCCRGTLWRRQWLNHALCSI